MLAVLYLSAAAQGTPPIRGNFSASELSPFIEAEWNASGDAAGSARRMFDAFDSRANLRGGLMKNNLKGQMVYWEQYALNSSITVHRADSPYSPSQEQAKAAQIAYIKEHHCIVVPDLTQLLLPHFGNWIKEGERSGLGGDLSWQVLSGTLNLSKEN